MIIFFNALIKAQRHLLHSYTKLRLTDEFNLLCQTLPCLPAANIWYKISETQHMYTHVHTTYTSAAVLAAIPLYIDAIAIVHPSASQQNVYRQKFYYLDSRENAEETGRATNVQTGGQQ